MTFQQLTYVVEISKCGSINKAAHKLFLSQSGISTAVRELEEELGIRFFVRSNRGVEFTPEGKEFLGYAVSLLEQKQRIERLYGEVDMAVRLGSRSMRHDASGGYPAEQRSWRGFEQALPRLAEGCRKVTEYAVQQGVRTMVENHGFFCQDSDRVEKLINTVAHDNFGWLVDMGNFLCADEDPAKAVGRAAPYAFYVHGKDFLVKSGMEPDPGSGFFRSRGGAYLRGTVVGHGNVPVRQCLAALKGAGYDGYIGLEFEGVEPTEWALRTGLENLRRAIEAI